MMVKLVVVFGFLLVRRAVHGLGPQRLRDRLGLLSRSGRWPCVPRRSSPPLISRCSSATGRPNTRCRGRSRTDQPVVTAFVVRQGESSRRFETGARLPDEKGLEARLARLTERATALARRGGFFVESVDPATGHRLSVEGTIRSDQTWQPEPGQHHAKARRRVSSTARKTSPRRMPSGFAPGSPTRGSSESDSGLLVAAWPSPRRRLVPAGGVRRDRRGGRALQRPVLELRSRQGLGHGGQDRRDPQRHRRPVDRAVARRHGLPHHARRR